MEKLTAFLKEFLVRDGQAARLLGYTNDEREFARYRVVVRPSGFFDCMGDPERVRSMLQDGLSFKGLPCLFGNGAAEWRGGTLVVSADLLASACFLLSRYEELLVAERDTHGRFSAKNSWLKRQGWLQRPLVDAYGSLLYRLLTGKEPVYPPATLCLTHDLDRIVKYGSWRNVFGGLRRGKFGELLQSALGRDPYWEASRRMLRKAAGKAGLRQLFFVYAALDSPYSEDGGCLSLKRAPASVLDELKRSKSEIGVHFSYASACHSERLEQELKAASLATERPTTASRYHFLAQLRLADLSVQESLGIRHEYTAGFADEAGFRLGTCRPVPFVVPTTGKITALTLHPLAAMDVCLSAYMRLSEDESRRLLEQLAAQVKQYGGEFGVLWHPSSMAESPMQERLLDGLLSAW